MNAKCIHFKQKNYTLHFLLCLSTFKTTPIALMKTSKLVEPAEINGSGIPVSGIEPVNNSYCIIKFCKKKEQSDCSLIYFVLLMIYSLKDVAIFFDSILGCD